MNTLSLGEIVERSRAAWDQARQLRAKGVGDANREAAAARAAVMAPILRELHVSCRLGWSPTNTWNGASASGSRTRPSNERASASGSPHPILAASGSRWHVPPRKLGGSSGADPRTAQPPRKPTRKLPSSDPRPPAYRRTVLDHSIGVLFQARQI